MHDSARSAVLLAAIALTSACKGERAGGPSPAPAALPARGEPVDVSAGSARLASPYVPRTHMYRGQLHAHTTNSDGKQSPATLMKAYRDARYDFVAITDHDHNTPDPGVSGILFIPGVENDHTCLHENRINATTVAPGARWPQDVIDQAGREGSFVQINHPDWPGQYPKNPCWSDAALLKMHGYDAVEVWNASNDYRNSNAERRIDYLLSNGRRTYLTAVDDCHDVRAAYCMTSSVNVFADALTLGDVMSALKSGDFYASSGALITSVVVRGGTITVSVPAASDITFIADGGRNAKTVRDALAADYETAGDEKYVRVKVTRTSDRRMAWSNPIYVTPAP